MTTYKLEELKFYSMRQSKMLNNESIFEIENNLSVNEKIEFIDQLKDGIASYLIVLFEKWNNEKDSLPQDSYGKPKTVSFKAWLRKNDTRGIIDKDYKIGSYYLFKSNYKNMSTICPTTEYGYSMTHTGESIVNQWFHDLCKELYRNEKEYFEDNDSKNIKLKRVKYYGSLYNVTFNNKEINDIIWNSKKAEDIEEINLDKYISAFEKLERKIIDISNEINSK